MLWLLLLPFALAAPPDFEATAADLLGRALASDLPMERLTELCDGIGPRLSGSEALDRALDWGEARMQADGLSTRRQEVMVPHWVRGEERLRLLAPQALDLPLLAIGNSIGTPKEGLEAEVVVVGSFEELEARAPEVSGRIVLFDVPFTEYGETVAYRIEGPSAAARHGAVGALVRSIAPVGRRTVHTGTLRYAEDAPEIPAAAIAAEDAMRLRRLAEGGETPRVHLYLGAHFLDDAPSANVIGEIRGREHPEEIVLISCHIDSWDVGQGAHDDGAGCVMVMEAGRLLAALPTPPRRTVRVVLFTNEENGRRGSLAYAAATEDEPHFAAFEADSGAGQPHGFAIDLRTGDEETIARRTAAWAAWLTPVADLLAPLEASRLGPGFSGVDILPLAERGVLALGLDQDMSDYWPIHHTEADTLDKIDPVLLKRNTAAVTVLAWWLSEQPAPVVD